MFPDPLMLGSTDSLIENEEAENQPVPFSVISVSGSKTVRTISSAFTTTDSYAGALKDAKAQLTLSHLETGKGNGRKDRGLIRLDLYPPDDAYASTRKTVSAYIVLDKPLVYSSQGSSVAGASAYALQWLRSFLTDENIAMFNDRQF